MNITTQEAEEHNIPEIEQDFSKQDSNENTVFSYNDRFLDKKEVSHIQFSGNLIFYDLNVKDKESESKTKLINRHIKFENLNYLDDGLRTYKVEGLFNEKILLQLVIIMKNKWEI